MNNNNELKEVTINEWIWIIFLILSIANIFGDEIEKKSLLEKKCHDDKARKLFIITASVALIIYLYFVISSYNQLKKQKQQNKNTQLQEINLLGNTLVFLGACVLIYHKLKNKQEITTDLI